MKEGDKFKVEITEVISIVKGKTTFYGDIVVTTKADELYTEVIKTTNNQSYWEEMIIINPRISTEGKSLLIAKQPHLVQ